MWITPLILLLSYHTAWCMKTFVTNEISIPLGENKDSTPVIMWSRDTLPNGYISKRFERLKGIQRKSVVEAANKHQEEILSGVTVFPPVTMTEVVPAGSEIIDKSSKFVSKEVESALPNEKVYLTPVTALHPDAPMEKSNDYEEVSIVEVDREDVSKTIISSPTPPTTTATTTTEIPQTTKKHKKRKIRKNRKKTTLASTPTPAITVPDQKIENNENYVVVTPEMPKTGESYLGGWNEESSPESFKSTPSLGSILNQFSSVPSSVSINDDDAVKEYYKKYYEEWYRQHNEAVAKETIIQQEKSPKKINIQFGRRITSTSAPPAFSSSEISTTQSVGTEKPSKEQLDKVCNYVGKISKSFGIKDMVTFAKNNCSFVKGFHPNATCEQIQSVMEYCATGLLVPTN